MAVLESCPKHNMVAYLEKSDGNAEFHEIIDFLARSSIHNALTIYYSQRIASMKGISRSGRVGDEDKLECKGYRGDEEKLDEDSPCKNQSSILTLDYRKHLRLMLLLTSRSLNLTPDSSYSEAMSSKPHFFLWNDEGFLLPWLVPLLLYCPGHMTHLLQIFDELDMQTVLGRCRVHLYTKEVSMVLSGRISLIDSCLYAAVFMVLSLLLVVVSPISSSFMIVEFLFLLLKLEFRLFPVVDLTGDEDPTDEDVDIGLGDSTGVLAPLGDEISLGGKKLRESDIGGGIVAGKAIITWDGRMTSYACIYGSSCKGGNNSMSNRYLVKFAEELGEKCFPAFFRFISTIRERIAFYVEVNRGGSGDEDKMKCYGQEGDEEKLEDEYEGYEASKQGGRHLDAKKKFVMYPRFISVFLDTQLKSVPCPLDHLPLRFDRPLPTSPIPDSILESSVNHERFSLPIKKLKKKSKPVITHHKAWMKSVSLKQRLVGNKSLKKTWIQKESVSKQGGKSAKAEPTVHKDHAFDELGDDAIDIMETEDAQGMGRTRFVVHDSFSQESSQKSFSREKEKGVHKLKDVENIERPRPTSTRSLLTLKPLLKINPKDKGKKNIEVDESDTESEDVNETEKKFKMLAHNEEITRKMQEDWETKEERKRLAKEEATNAALIQDFDDIKARMEADRLLALRLQEEERERAVHSAAIRNRPPTRTQLRNQMMTYLKHVGNKKHSDLKNKTFEEIQALYEKVKRFDESFTAVGSTEDERKIREMNKGAKDLEQKRLKKKVSKETPKKEDTSKVPTKVDVTEQGTKKRKGGHIKMLARKRKRPQSNVDSDDEHISVLKIVTYAGTIDDENNGREKSVHF
ncbi:hypothetical protein Tco_0040360 [Tanacetum coccineum]